MAPHIDSLSQHQAAPGQRLYANGSGFAGASGVQVNDQWADGCIADGDTIVSFTVPQLDPGTYWVIVHTPDGTSSCDDASQQLTIGGPPAAALTLASITPDTIVVGDETSYYLSGTGLSGVLAFTLANHAVTFQGTDDANMAIYLPAHLDGINPGDTVVLTAVGGDGQTATLSVPTMGRPAAGTDPGTAAAAPSVGAIEPAELGPDGGQVSIHGGNFTAGAYALIGSVQCNDVSVVSDSLLQVTVPSLSGSEGQQLVVAVISNGWSSGETDVLLTVTSGT